MIAERKAIGPIELCAILRRVKHWFVEQVWVAPNQKALVSTIRVFTASLQVMKHALEYINRRLQIEEESNISLVGHYMSEHNISQCEFNKNQFMDSGHFLFYASFILAEDVYFIFGGMHAQILLFVNGI